MTDLLLVTWDGGGNLPPALGIAREVVRRGGRVRVLGNRVQRAAVVGAGFEFIEYSRGRDHVSADPRGTLDGALRLVRLFADRGIGTDAREILDRDPADAVLVDCLLWGALDVLADGPTPVVSLVHSIGGYFERNAAGPVGMLARLRGVDAPVAGRRAALTVITTRTDFEEPGSSPRGEHTGFVWQGTPREAQPRERPRVLVSFSTTVFPGQARALQRVLDALAEEDVDVTVTSGAVDPTELNAPPNARVLRRADHSELLQTASLVIGHGGHATTARALAAGVPVLVLPMHPLMDQPAVGRAVARLGAGATIPKSSSAVRIRAQAMRLLEDAEITATARRIGTETRERDGAVNAVDAIEELLPQS